MKLIWLSDIHLNFLNERLRKEFYRTLIDAQGDAIVISGDIGESQNFVSLVKELYATVVLPVYFVLGNHDYYGSGVKNVRKKAAKLGWLGKDEGVPLSEEVFLTGVDGWGDCRLGDFDNSKLVMSDWIYISDLFKAYGTGDKDAIRNVLQRLADNDAAQLKANVEQAIKWHYRKVVIVTHVPPFEQASLHLGKPAGPDGLPFYASKCLGDAILPIAQEHPDVEFIWLSGHTHSRAEYKPCANMVCKVAKAEYYRPSIEEVFDVV